MATATSVPIQWIPEDDLLLKNAVEAGASLEALAKGAVQFSRRFTFQELRDRWHSLLYEPDISTQASARMFELEISGFNSSSKLNRLENNFKGNKEVPLKRKSESIRRHYYAMRKKIRSELFSNIDLGFFEPNLHECSEQAAVFQKHGILDGNNPQGGNCSDNIGLHEEDLDILCQAFPETMRDITVVSNAPMIPHTECPNPIEDNCPTEIIGRYGFDENASTSITQDESKFFEANIKNKKSLRALQRSPINMEGCAGLQDSGLPVVPSGREFIGGSEKKHLPTFNSTKENLHDDRVELEGSQKFNPSNTDDIASFRTMRFPSHQPNLHPWKKMQDVSASLVPLRVSQGDTAQVAVEMLPDDGEGKISSSSTYRVVHSGSLLSVRRNNSDIINLSTVSESEFADPDSLLNLSNEDEILLMDVDEKHAIDKSCIDNLNSLLLNSPNDVQEDDNVGKLEVGAVMVSEICSASTSSGNPVVSEVTASTVPGEQRNAHLEVNVPSNSTLNSEFNELSDGNICCTLNTEDTEIPSNDDIFLLIHPSTSFGSSATQPISTASMDLPSAARQKDKEQVVSLLRKVNDSVEAFAWSHKVEPQSVSEPRPSHPLVGRAAKNELLDSKPNALLPGCATRAFADSCKGKSLHAIQKVSSDRLLEKDVEGVGTRVGDRPSTVMGIPQYTEAGSGKTVVPEDGDEPSMSDLEDSQIDDDVPCFSDVEAMILEMDLHPFDQDSNITRQVPSYQYDGTKRTIIRLEQCARSSLHRVMTSQGALAILYSRHLRHYIRKPKVILGRSTEDIDVDIDLSKEGRANKISRRQALIKMEADGSFFLRNLGKSPVSVNGIAIATGQLLTLSSSCLIEIRGMSFVFEINERNVRQHLENVAQKKERKDEQI
ncbi:Forkhead-associated (FHA) domain-containing protein [Forsythia ovata]|uniref:Forkhead-associated (FHA) domain-containing protein n=1 Tax=Forsythia ovata TaxID=205694 RepID=A0ABD1WSM4_9LAMI